MILLSSFKENPTAAFLQYEKLRKKRTAMIQQLSRRNAKVFHLKGIAAWARNRAAKRAGGSTMNKLYGYDALSVVINSKKAAQKVKEQSKEDQRKTLGKPRQAIGKQKEHHRKTSGKL